MKIRQIAPNGIFESLRNGEYYIWNITFQDGSVTPTKIKWDETSKEDLEAHFKKPIKNIEYNFNIRGGDQVDVDPEYHTQQDRIEKNKAKQTWQTYHIDESDAFSINRSAPANDVSYEQVLNDVIAKWNGQKTKVNELSLNTLRRYDAKVKEVDPMVDKFKTVKNVEGHHKAVKRIAAMTGDRTKKKSTINELSLDTLRRYDAKVKEVDPMIDKFKTVKHVEGHRKAAKRIAAKTGDRRVKTYEAKLEKFVKEAVDMSPYHDILSKQHDEIIASKPKAKVIPIEFHGWTIKYRPASSAGEKVEWLVIDKKDVIKQKGSASSNKDAVAAAQDWITSGGGSQQAASKNVTIDFNVDFAKEHAPGGEQFYATIDQDKGMPILIISYEPQPGFKTSHIRTQLDKITAGTTKLPVISLSPKESNAVGLQPNGRYVLGSKDQIDDNTAMFPLIFQGIVQGKGDMMKLGKPGLTVAHSRD